MRPIAPWLLALLGGLLSAPAVAQPPAGDERQAAADLELISALERVVARAIERSERSVVSIARKAKAPDYTADSHPFPNLSSERGQISHDPRSPDFVASGFATGVVLDRSGLVLTNHHVLGEDPEENEIFVTTSSRNVFRMRVKASDERSDLAVLTPLQPGAARGGDFIPIEFGDAATLRKGQIVIALGNPYAIARDGQVSASWGIVSNLGRKAIGPRPITMAPKEKTLHELGTLIQTDAKLNLGTSGGALINLRGEMVGLTTSLAATAGFEQAAGYAIPIDKAFLRIIDKLKEGREVEYGLLGIVPGDLPLGSLHGGPARTKVDQVSAFSPAAKARIQRDDLVTHVDGQPIFDADGLRLHVGRLPPDAVTTLTIVRNGQTSQRRVALTKFPTSLTQIVTERPASWRGVHVDYLSAVLLRQGRELLPFGAGPDYGALARGGVAARDVEEGTPAWQAGLRRGAIISHVGKTPVETPEDFRRAVADIEGQVELRLIDEQGRSQTVSVPAAADGPPEKVP
ncbi:MAG TPA: trypsin-like peptidase domain-containing protein [Pirellulales bacterium]